MASQVQIVNLALSQLGKAQITSMDEASDPARRASIAWPIVRRAVLRDHAWGFATRTVQLALADEHIPGWAYVYHHPSDCVKIIRLFNEISPDDPQPYTKQQTADGMGMVLACNVPYAWLTYVADVDDTSKFDAIFVDALVYRLAAALAVPLTGDQSKVASMMQLYTLALDNAKAADAREYHRTPNPEHGNPYYAAR